MSIALIICIVGLVLYAVCARRGPAEIAEIGRLAFAVALLAVLLK